ncbi:hypothetical protein K8I85_06640, partial [bacterium]|nr:hypothetical protein [bacterium]
MTSLKRIGALTLPLLALLMIGAPSADAQDHVLFVTINGGYNADGSNAFDMLVAAGADADYVLLNSDGLAETAIDDA